MSGLQLVKFVDALTITGPGVAAGGSAGQVLTKKSGDNYDTEWKDGGAVGNMADLGIYIGNSQPPNMVSYDEWVTNRTGYWAWWEISTAAVNAAINVPGSVNSVTSGVIYVYPSSWANIVVPTDTQTILSGSVAVSATTIGTVAMPVIGQLLPITSGTVVISSGNTVAVPGSAFTISSGTVAVTAGSSSPVTVTVIGGSLDITSGTVVISTSLVVPVTGTSLDITAGTVAVSVSESVTISGSVVPISSGTVAVTSTSETTAPTVTAFTAGTPSGSTVPITTFTATDNVGVTGYLITESATPPLAGAAGWTGTAPTSYSAAGTGSVTLYAWAKDAAGNVSTAATQSVTIAAGGPVTLSFETSSVVDSSGATWTAIVPTAVSDYGTVGSITSGVAGGDSGNCLRIVQSAYNDGFESYYAMDTYITRTMNVGAGTLSLRIKRGDVNHTGFISIDGVTTSFGATTVGSFVSKTVNVPVQKNNVVVKIGFTAGIDPGVNGYIDSVSIPEAV